MTRLKIQIDRFTQFMAWLSGAAFLLLSFYITASAIGRYTGLYYSQGNDDISAFVLAGASTWAMAYALRVNGHVRIDVVFGTLPRAWREVLSIVAQLLTAVFAGLLAVYGWRLTGDSFALGIRSVSMIQTPMFLPQGIVAFGYSMLALEALLLAALALTAKLSRAA